LVFVLQAVLTWLVAMPFLAARNRPNAAMRVRAEGLTDQVSLKEWRNHLVNDLSADNVFTLIAASHVRLLSTQSGRSLTFG
jgi:steroid 5-alpha reductase family enzyme